MGINGLIIMLFMALATTHLQIFYKIILNNKDIVKSIIVPDDNIWRNGNGHQWVNHYGRAAVIGY